MRILLTGPIGSGKTTQARILSQELHLKLIKIGELVRNEAEKDTPEGKLLKGIILGGGMVPDEIAARLFKEALHDLQSHKGFISDGYPRRLSQIKAYDPRIDFMFYIKVPEDEVLRRLKKRGRLDDKPEVIKQRIAVYHNETEPLLDYYRKQAKLIEINGMGTMEEVKLRIKTHLADLGE